MSDRALMVVQAAGRAPAHARAETAQDLRQACAAPGRGADQLPSPNG